VGAATDDVPRSKESATEVAPAKDEQPLARTAVENVAVGAANATEAVLPHVEAAEVIKEMSAECATEVAPMTADEASAVGVAAIWQLLADDDAADHRLARSATRRLATASSVRPMTGPQSSPIVAGPC